MKHWLFCLILSAVMWVIPMRAQAAVVTPELFRLQVVAESDSEADQDMKLQVRNAVLVLAEQLFADAQSAEEAAKIAQRHLLSFERAAKVVVPNDCRVRVEVGEFVFPDRIYGGVCVPAGEYSALRITLGAGQGHNWWCVLYPTLCGVDESNVNADGTITFYSHTLEFLKKLFGGAKG